MPKKLVVIIGTGESAKAQAGTMYAVNALKHGWMEEVKLFFFGPAQALLLEDPKLQLLVESYQEEDESAIACKFVADQEGIAEALDDLNLRVEYVGEQISTLINSGYVPMVW